MAWAVCLDQALEGVREEGPKRGDGMGTVRLYGKWMNV